ncbi:MAG: type II toxin-antitoxin system VapC family toxin [Candidatus Aenigmarchaeota archaeon]|nr:type II toxin-antitoxin system VapC family toxin [Candidatus Aenigmarchaeota archaeon]
MMFFIDSNIFLYAFLSTKRKLKDSEKQLKETSRKILKKIDSGEKVATSVVHISEISNVLESIAGKGDAQKAMTYLILNENIEILEVNKSALIMASDINKKHLIGLNDCIAIVLMQQNNINKIYSADRHFDSFDWIERQ